MQSTHAIVQLFNNSKVTLIDKLANSFIEGYPNCDAILKTILEESKEYRGVTLP